MTDQITNKILQSYGYKGVQPQYKSIIFPIQQLKNTIDDHKLQQVSPELQEILECERARKMVREQGITLEKTKEFFIEKIKEYNSILDLKHLHSGSTFVTPQKKNNVFKRHVGDQGQITNYHLVLNWQNLNLVFNEIENNQSKLNSSFQNQQSIKIVNKSSTQKGNSNSLVTRLDKKINDYDIKMLSSVTTTAPSRKQSNLQDISPLLNCNLRKKPSIDYNKRRGSKISTFTKTVQVIKQNRELYRRSTPQTTRDMIKSYINDSFNPSKLDTEESVKERSISECKEKYKDLTKQLQQQQVDSNQVVMEEQILNFDNISIYDTKFQNVDFEKIKRIKERRNQVIKMTNKRMQPQYVHLGGSKFPLKNDFKNQQNYQNTMNKLLIDQLKNEFRKLKVQDDGIDLETLEGPPQKIDFNSSNLRQDYNDVKVSKIVQKLKQN